jgi:hypothetical protein
MLKFKQKPALKYIPASSIGVHKAAFSAKFFSDNAKKQYDEFMLPEILSKLNILFKPVIVVESPKKKYKAIANWESLPLHNEKKVFVLHIKDQLNFKQIELMAWSSVLDNQVYSWHRTSNLSQLVDLLDECPNRIKSHIASRIFELTKSKLSSSRSIVTQISKESLDVVKNQLKNNKASPGPRINTSIFDRLMMDDNE